MPPKDRPTTMNVAMLVPLYGATPRLVLITRSVNATSPRAATSVQGLAASLTPLPFRVLLELGCLGDRVEGDGGDVARVAVHRPRLCRVHTHELAVLDLQHHEARPERTGALERLALAQPPVGREVRHAFEGREQLGAGHGIGP